MKKFILISILFHLIVLGGYQIKQMRISSSANREKHLSINGINLKNFIKISIAPSNGVKILNSSNVDQNLNGKNNKINDNQAIINSTNLNNIGVHESGKLELIQFVEPKYPAIARQKNIEGRVVLELEVAPKGTIESVHIIKSSGFDILDKAAIDSAKLWKFKPSSEVSNIKYSKEIVFQLNN